MGMGIATQILMAGSTASPNRRSPRIGEAEYLARVSVAVDVGLPRPVAGLATLFFRLALGKDLLVRRVRQARVGLVMARLACLRANIARGFGVVAGGNPEAERCD